ncbi:MAG: hypothetical protein AAB631_00190 [Patescibacteria group bacterium]
MSIFFVFSPSVASAQSPTIIAKSFYAIEINYSDPVSWFGGSVLGFAPKQALYHETWKPGKAPGYAFRVELIADGKERWFLVDQDSSVQSFVHLPRADLKNLGKDAILLVGQILHFLNCTDACSTTLQGILHIDTSEIVSKFRDRKPFEIPDSEKIQLRGTHSRFVTVTTRNVNTRDPYIAGDILIERVNGYTIYPYVSVYLFDQKIWITLYLRKFLVEYQ